MNRGVAIIGAGLSGLSLARSLIERGRDVLVLEARDRIGGRILSMPASREDRYDLGPAWFWPRQPRMAELSRTLGLETFEQHSTGVLMYEDESGTVRPYQFSTMAGSLRINGGVQRLVEGLAERLPEGTIRTSAPVSRITRGSAGFSVEVPAGTIEAEQVVLSVPPRVALETIAFDPGLPESAAAELRAVPTWMAGHTKVVAVYSRPFWRERGLSGDGVSRRGPLAEIHDASPLSGREGALFGFVGAPIDGSEGALREAAVSQLTRMFGPEAGSPDAVLIQNWAAEPYTSTELDTVLTDHPRYGMPSGVRALASAGIVFASSEMGSMSGGYLEGALEAVEAALEYIEIDRSERVERGSR